MATATKLDHNGRILDGLSRARVLLLEHRDLPPVSVFVHITGQADVEVSSLLTFSEDARRHAVDVLAEACHLDKPYDQPGPYHGAMVYTTENDHWKIHTRVKGHRCDSCGGVLL